MWRKYRRNRFTKKIIRTHWFILSHVNSRLNKFPYRQTRSQPVASLSMMTSQCTTENRPSNTEKWSNKNYSRKLQEKAYKGLSPWCSWKWWSITKAIRICSVCFKTTKATKCSTSIVIVKIKMSRRIRRPIERTRNDEFIRESTTLREWKWILYFFI